MSKRVLLRNEPSLQAIDAAQHEVQQSISRQPSEMLRQEVDHPIVQCESFQPCVDEFIENGPSADIEKVKDLAAEIASQHSNVDPRSLSKSLSSFGRLPLEHTTSGGTRDPAASGMSFGLLNDASVQSFSSLVEFENKRNYSWQESIKNLLSDKSMESEMMHKEYKFHETSKEQKITSKDWDINVSMESMLMSPNFINNPNNANLNNSDVTNNIVTSVEMNQDQNREGSHSVDIRSVAIGRDTDGRMASYEMLKTTFNLTPTSSQVYNNGDNTAHFNRMQISGVNANTLPPRKQNSMGIDPSELEPTPINFKPMPPTSSLSPQSRPIVPMMNAMPPHAASSLPFEPNPILIPPHHPHHAHPHTMPPPPRPFGGLMATKKVSETGLIDAQQIKDDDVLLERGGKGNHHKGSRYYRRLINQRRKSYQDLPDAARAEKMNISLSIVLSLKATGARFIHKKAGQYHVMTDREARNKISQALREKKERVMLD